MFLLDLFEAKVYFIIMVVLLVVIPVVALAWAFQKGKGASSVSKNDETEGV